MVQKIGVLLVNYTVVAFSVDNAIGIVTKSDGKTRRHVLQVLAWIFAIAICSTQPYFYNVLTFWFDPDYSYCVAMLPHAAEEAYHWSMIAGLYLFPIVTIVVANAVAVVMWAANRSPPLAEKPNASAIITDIRTWTLELFITIALGLVVFICWTPVAVFRMVRSEDRYQNVRNTLFFALDVFSLMTYCFIPAVYGVYRAITKTRAESTHGLEPKPTSRD
ncbi:uncharacterized protein LOC121378794 isoform X2 [Gigantopelta aegis]|uniref:uncharacterized protein LOC121378794 isoform X2 n=1 Tax=Gigantopelta aegis TaxID=1735272 RepID=UPI001B887BA4|nr:uncharacterized protein LOC121378794 isoform X2 [Gigantopelta aegis]